MKIAFNPSTVAALTSPPNNKDITFDLKGHSIYARGVEFKGTDTNTWRDIKVNNVSIGSHTLDLRNGSNTTLTNTNGVVTINSTWRPVVDSLTSNSTTSSLSANQGRVLAGLINGKSDSDHNHDDRYVKRSGDTMLGALNFANNTWNKVGDDSYMGDCNVSGHVGIKAANTIYPGVAFFNNASTFLGNLTAYNGNIKYGTYSLQFLDNGNTSVGASTWTNPFSAYDSNAVKDGQAICVWGQNSYLSNLATDTGGMSLWLKRVNAKNATLNMVLDGEYYANGNQRLAHVSEIPSSLKNPYALTISLNGTSQGPYDGSAAKNINITPGSIGAATSNHNHDGRYVYNYRDTANVNGQALNQNALFMSTTSGITKDWWHILQAAWNGEYRWNSQIAFPTQNRNGMYYRSGLDNNTKWGSWVKLLDTNNYSSTLDSRYYTESEVNSLLNAKLNRQNLSYGTWNPRGYNLAADYCYNGGDLSISENSGQIHVSIDGYFWQNKGKYRVLDTSDVAGLKGNLTVHQYLSSTDTTWWPLIWGGSSHANTSDSTGAVYKSHDKLSWQTSTQTLYATNIRTKNIEYLSIGGGICWDPHVESASDISDAASITLVKSGVAGGTTLVLSQMNDANDTIQFKTNAAARLYHNSYPILTTQNTYVSNNKGYINGTEITQVNNADKVDNRHAISTIPNTGIIYKAAIYTSSSLTSYWVRLASIPSINQNNEFVATIHVQSGHSNPGRSAILLVYLRGYASSLSKSFKICCNSNYNPNRFRLYYKDSDKTSEIWYQTTGQFDGIITTVISQSSEGSLYEGLTLYSGSITAVQTPSMSTYLSAQVSTITDNISGNASTATKLATPRKIWGQSFDGTADVDNTLRIRKTTGNYCEGIRIQTGDGAWSTIILGATADSGTNTNAWSIHRKSDNNFAISRNSSDGLNGLVMTSIGMGLGTTAPTQRLDVAGNIRATGQLYLPINGNYNAILMGNDCWMGDCNIGGVIGLSGTGNANAGGIKFGKGGMHIGYNGSNHYSSGTSLWSNFNADLLDGVHVNQLCRIYTFNVHNHIIKVGTLTSGQHGHVCKLRFNSGIGYNASNQDKAMTVVIRASNGNANSNGFYFEAHSESYRAGAFTTFYLHQTSKTQCELYMAAFIYSGQSTYEISFSDGDLWTNEISVQSALPTSNIFTLPNYQIAYNDYNVASATKLQTARNIWGQSFDGTRDVNGTIYINNGNSENGAIILNNNVNTHARISAIGDQVVFNTGSALRFGGVEWEYSDWAGLKYDTVANTIYLGIADGTVFNYYSSKRTNGTLKLPGISNIDLNSGSSIRGIATNGSPYVSYINLYDTSIFLSAYGDISMSTGPGAIKLTAGQGANASIGSDFKIEASRGVYLNQKNSGNVWLCQGGGNVSIGYSSSSYKLDVNGQMRADGFHHGSVNSNNYMLLAGGGYKSFGGDDSNPIFLGYLNLDHGNDGTVSSFFSCLGYSVPFTYTRGGNYCRIYIPNTTHQVFYIKAATASVNYSGGGMDTWVGHHRGAGAWWLHCYASGTNEVKVKGFRQSNYNNDSWWGGNPLWSTNDGANKITVCIFGYVKFR